MWKTGPNDKHINKYKHDHIYKKIHMTCFQ
jgi:hypothetical protein